MAEDNEQLKRARKSTPSRHSPGAWLGRQELADLVNEWIYLHRDQVTAVDNNYIGKLERGVIRWPDEAYRAALRSILGANNDVQLGFYDTRRTPRDVTPAEVQRFLNAAEPTAIALSTVVAGQPPAGLAGPDQSDDEAADGDPHVEPVTAAAKPVGTDLLAARPGSTLRSPGSESVILVQRWTGFEARALRLALHMGVREFAGRLGITPSAVSRWEKLGDETVLRPETQQMLDTALVQAGDEDRHRFRSELAETSPNKIPAGAARRDAGDHDESQRMVGTASLDRSVAVGEGVGKALRRNRRRLGLDLQRLAALLKVTPDRLAEIETGQEPVQDLELLARASVTLSIPPQELGLSEDLHHLVMARHSLGELLAKPPSPGDLSAGAISASQASWRDIRLYLNRHRPDLGRRAAGLYPDEVRVGPTSLITRPGWLPDHPLDLDRVQLGWRAGMAPVRVRGDEPEVWSVLPLRAPGKRYGRYTSATRYIEPPSLFENRPSYRLLDLSWQRDAGRMSFGLSTYFDKLDICEAVGHEYAAAVFASGPDGAPTWAQLPLRALIGDPFDLAGRVAIPAVTTLTIRVDHGRPAFLLHWRDPASVATAGGMYDAIPAGEFQPSSVGMWDQVNDFDLWRNIVREFSEELLGAPEHDGSLGAPIDYDEWRLYRQLQAARREGRLRVVCLGAGLDALTLAATIMTVAVFDGPTFDAIFGEIVPVNAEGVTVTDGEGSRTADGFPFTEEVVARMLEREPVASPGAACLHLAWAHRGELLRDVAARAAGTVGGVAIGPVSGASCGEDAVSTPQAWRAVRTFQREHRGELAQAAASLYGEIRKLSSSSRQVGQGFFE